MNLKELKDIYFLGIGGIGMSALARYFLKAGVRVSGYDRVRTPLTEALEEEGIGVIYADDPGLLPENTDMVVYTPAIPKDQRQFVYLSSTGVPIFKRSEVLGMVTREKFTIAVAGTHGKTSVSSILAHILNFNGRKVTAFVGGIMKNYESNIILNDDPEIIVVEADEFDRSFLKLHPSIAIITAADADHLDIYGSKESMLETFREFAGNVDPAGHLIVNDKIGPGTFRHPHLHSYGFNDGSEFRISNYVITNHRLSFQAMLKNKVFLKDAGFRIPGRFNLENALAASAAAFLAGVEEGLCEALETYEGVQRRFDIRVNLPEIVFIDDYAHHPEEISACINAVKEMYPGKRITGIFQPHLYSRTRDFADGFAASLEQLDDIILLDIYPARELPIEHVSSKMILDKIKNTSRQLCARDALVETVKSKNPEVLLTLGAGDIDRLVEPIKEMLLRKYA